MTQLKWKKDFDDYYLVINKDLTITLSKEYGYWAIWLNDEKIVKYIDLLKDAKEKGMKIAEAILYNI